MRRIWMLYSTILLSLMVGIGLATDFRIQPDENGSQPISTHELSQVAEISPLTAGWELLDKVNQDRAMTDLRRLTGIAPICTDDGCYTIKNRETGTEGLQWAKDYIYTELVSLGYSIEVQDWSHSGYSDQNLLVRKPGKISPDEEIYFVAHIDGVLPEGAERSPAADDNGSGVVDLLELARVLSGRPFYHTIVLLFTTGEEHGALGARSYVDQLSTQELSAIKYVINVDMVGYDSDNDGVMQLWSGDHLPSLIFTQMLSKIINDYDLNLTPIIITDCA